VRLKDNKLYLDDFIGRIFLMKPLSNTFVSTTLSTLVATTSPMPVNLINWLSDDERRRPQLFPVGHITTFHNEHAACEDFYPERIR
jgi:hypothetical protein